MEKASNEQTTSNDPSLIKAKKERREHRIIAKNLPFNQTDEEILELFKGAIAIQRHTKNGVLSGAVFLQCQNMTDVNRFIQSHNNRVVEGRVISVSHLVDREVYLAKTPNKDTLSENERGRLIRKETEAQKKRYASPEGEEDRTVFITNLSFKETKEEVKEAFSKFGEIEQCTLVMNKETGISTGRAFILFKDKSHAKAALKEQVLLNNRVLVVLKYVSPETLRDKVDEKTKKDRQRDKTIQDRKEGRIPGRDPERRSECRVYISHMKKTFNRKTLSKAIEEYFLKKHDKKLKLRGVNLSLNNCKKNPGYAFVTFKFPEDATIFLENQGKLKRALGREIVAEYAMESKEFLEKGIKKKPSKEERLAKKQTTPVHTKPKPRAPAKEQTE
ncbi:hypothetical protein NEFER03_0162 [Nematocida sp. LUAm3]|nr:hypothetical protein NEFER03_0162 [Nematocida sp. LUAm3]KAI5173615.1 hypothetical protein NEFER02_0131 [Nematocida sp. LUAm2]KAI5176836.1 hypothetical protein NEFER01_0161 [Nematocida sp. LUAm1]